MWNSTLHIHLRICNYLRNLSIIFIGRRKNVDRFFKDYHFFCDTNWWMKFFFQIFFHISKGKYNFLHLKTYQGYHYYLKLYLIYDIFKYIYKFLQSFNFFWTSLTSLILVISSSEYFFLFSFCSSTDHCKICKAESFHFSSRFFFSSFFHQALYQENIAICV